MQKSAANCVWHTHENHVVSDFDDFFPRNKNVLGCFPEFSFARDDNADDAGVLEGNNEVAGLSEAFSVLRVDNAFRSEFGEGDIHTP